MSAFGNAITAMEHGLVASCFRGLLSGDDAWNKIQSFDIAMEETSVLQRNEFDLLICIFHLCGLENDPNV